MYKARRGFAVTAANEAAVTHLDAAIESYLGFRTDVGDHLKRALAADPHCALPLCARGYFLLLMAARGLIPRAKDALAAAAAAQDRVTPREQARIAAPEACAVAEV